MHKYLTQVKEKLDSFNLTLIKEDARKDELTAQLERNTKECERLERDNKILVEALHLLEQCNVVSRDYVKTEVEQLVTQSLRSIFGDATIQFDINFVTKRNQTEAEFTLSHKEDKTHIQGDILYSYGGGVADIISISLRIIIMQMMKIKGPLILDEPGKYVSAQYINAFGKFLIESSNAFDRQIIMVTHNDKLAALASNTIEVYQINRVSQVR